MSSAITLITTGLQLYSHYKQDRNSIDNRFNEIETIHITNLTSRIWVSDLTEIEQELEALNNLTFIEYLEVADSGKIIAKSGTKQKNNVINKSLPIIYHYNGQDLIIGDLFVQASLDAIYKELIDEAWEILLSNGIKTFLVTGFIFYLFNQLITRHLIKLAAYAKEIDINDKNFDFDLNRPKKVKNADELDLLTNALKTMHKNLHDSFDQLKESRESFRSLVETSNAIPWEFDPTENQLTYIGPQVINLFGYDQKSWYNETAWLDRTYVLDKNLLSETLNRVLSQNANSIDHELECRIICEDKTVKWVRISVFLNKDEIGNFKIRGYIFDINEKKQAELSVKDQEIRINNHNKALLYLANNLSVEKESFESTIKLVNETVYDVLDCISSSVWLQSNDKKQLRCVDIYPNNDLSKFKNIEIQFTTNSSLVDILNRPDSAEFKSLEQQLLQLEDTSQHHYTIAEIHKGKQIIGLIVAIKTIDKNKWRVDEINFINAVTGIISLTMELWSHQQTTNKLEQYQKQLETLVSKRTREVQEQAHIIDQIHDSVISADLSGNIKTWNQGAENLFGYTSIEMTDKPIQNLFSDNTKDLFTDTILTQLENFGCYETETKMLKKTGHSFFGLLSLSLYTDKKNRTKAIVFYILDISDRKLAELELQQHTAELAAVNNELEAFCYSVSHDLRAPLRSISGFSSILLEETSSTATKQEKDYLDRIINATHRMSELINDLLDLSRVTRAEMNLEIINISEMVWKIISELHTKNIKFDIQANISIMCDSKFMQIALTNLISNAVKYCQYVDHPTVSLKFSDNTFCLKDNGVGFDMQFANKLFIPFQRLHTDSEFEGTGIGLAIVDRIIAKHHGKIWVEAAPNQGCAFYFTLNSSKSLPQISEPKQSLSI